MASVSLQELFFEVQGKGTTGCNLKRHLSPRTVGAMLRKLPVEGHAHLLGSMPYIEARLDSGVERPRSEFGRGEVAYLPSSGSVCFFRGTTASKRMTPLGSIADPGLLDLVEQGDVLRIYAA